ncbi:unnamed protein product [Bursaphelenchus xylophilus]|uniref:(pine wood nematode) hypothetical protein n=1 Tax=Bursaphelenchus xylophilus TaxID=6326 RepID=A0A1I7SM11_BURXY|nr:unnamed protein product [Bursaphelenchus xylophilus]CAG9129957.1 unnamed protein product [Bursaphelenchus xylophilus]
MPEVGRHQKTYSVRPVEVVRSASATSVSETRIDLPPVLNGKSPKGRRRSRCLDCYVVLLLTISTVFLLTGASLSFTEFREGKVVLLLGALGLVPTIPSLFLLSRRLTDPNDVIQVYCSLSYAVGTVCILSIYHVWKVEGYKKNKFTIFLNSLFALLLFLSSLTVQCFRITEVKNQSEKEKNGNLKKEKSPEKKGKKKQNNTKSEESQKKGKKNKQRKPENRNKSSKSSSKFSAKSMKSSVEINKCL